MAGAGRHLGCLAGALDDLPPADRERALARDDLEALVLRGMDMGCHTPAGVHPALHDEHIRGWVVELVALLEDRVFDHLVLLPT
jgi:hypothetical protein